MGLAASQARLLSITSRMSDNELRSQIISNAKMRLATDSSKVSDEYIAALNETQLMFSNYSPTGDAQNKVLTFNNLMEYSSYNTQYGIVNNNGDILVSQTDATNFKNSDSLNEFLENYGLEYKTSYFENYANDRVYYYDQYTGIREAAKLDPWVDCGITVGDMQEIYEGNFDTRVNGDVIHYGYEENLNSKEYGAYQILTNNYLSARDTYKTELRKQQKAWFGGDTIVPDPETGRDVQNLAKDNRGVYHDFEYYMNKVTSLSESNIKENLTYYRDTIFGQFYNNVSNFLDPEKSDTYKKTIERLLASANQEIDSTGYNFVEGQPTGYIKYDKDGNFVGYVTSGTSVTFNNASEASASNVTGIESFPVTALQYGENFEDENYRYEPLYYYEVSSDAGKDGFSREIPNGDGTFTTKYYKYGDGTEPGSQPYYITEGGPYDGYLEDYKITANDILDALQSLYSYFRDNTINNLKSEPFESPTVKIKDEDGKEIDNAVVYNAKKDYVAAASALAEFLYGQKDLVSMDTSGKINGTLKDYIDYLGDADWLFSTNWNDQDLDNDGKNDSVDQTHYNPFADIDDNTGGSRLSFTFLTEGDDVTYIYLNSAGEVVDKSNADATAYPLNATAVKDIYLIEKMLDVYGEPRYTWIDDDPNENATAKAQWYTNLYERMQEGYTTMPGELQNSSEWMQFAFESGLVHMEQVDKSNTWVSTSYSSCSNITEDTVNIDTTVAEAKYTREMNKIQAKDQQYDMELKNIDTEHNSLEQEYESIKSVISKNIERNYKLFQQG